MRRALGLILICAAMGFAQAPAPQKLKSYIAELDRLDTEAKAAYDREMAREKAAEKAGDCPQALSTRAIVECLGNEIATTTANFQAFADAIRAILAAEAPGDQDAAIGPTGKPLTRAERLKQFDDVSAAWDTYRKAQTAEAYDLWKGGTIAPIQSLTCELMLLRSRMREMNLIYDAQLRHR